MTFEKTRIQPEHLAKMRWYAEADIVCYSHTIPEGVLEEWNAICDYLKVERRGEHQIELQFTIPELQPGNDLYVRLGMYSTIFLVSLNIGCFGHFWWPPPYWPFRYKNLYDIEKKTPMSISVVVPKDRPWGKQPLAKTDIRRAAEVFAFIGKLDGRYFELYSIGATLLTASNIEHDFYTEVFSCFFRLIERFVKVEILRETSSDLDISRMESALLQLGIEENIVQEFRQLYIVRGRDAMHALGREVELTFEEAGKCKVICDLMLLKYAQQQLNAVGPDGASPETRKENSERC